MAEDEDASEDAEGEDNIDSSLLEPEGVQEPDHANQASSPGRASVVSGTTAKTTFSQEEIEELDTDVMLDSLKKLDTASNELLDALMPAVPLEVDELFATLADISTPGTRASKIYQKRLNAFMLYKADFTTTQEFVRPQNVSRAMFDVASIEAIPEGARRPDSIMYKANLTNMLHMLLVKSRDADAAGITEALESVNQAFPTAVAGSEYNSLAVNLSIALTTQLAVNRIQSLVEDPTFHPQGIATHAFFEEDGDGAVTYRQYNALHLGSVPEQQERAALDRVNSIVSEIKATFDDSNETDPSIAIEKLRETYSWVNFLGGDLVPYMVERKRTLDTEVHMAGGIENLDLEIKRSVQNKDSFKQLAATRAMLAQARQHPGNSRGSTAGAAQYLRALSQPDTPSQQGVAPTAQMTAPVSNNGGYPQLGHINGMTQDPALAGSNLHELSAIQDMDKAHTASAAKGRGKGRGKAKAFNERQAGAQRVEWDDSQSQAGLVSYISPATHQNTVLGKRTRDGEEEHWDPTQDGGPQEDEDDAFQTHRVDDAAADARRHAIQSARPSQSQPLHLRPEYDNSGTQQPPAKRRNPGSAIPTSAEYPDTIQPSPQRPHPNPHIAPASTALAQEYQQAAWAARQYRILSHAKPARERRAWTDLETEALMTYINEWPEEDNLHYAAMKRKDETDEGLRALEGRTAEDIRFRARNMKVNFLLSRHDLHPNWMKVQLAKKEIDKLHSRGISYMQVGQRGVAPTGEVQPQIGEQNE